MPLLLIACGGGNGQTASTPVTVVATATSMETASGGALAPFGEPGVESMALAPISSQAIDAATASNFLGVNLSQVAYWSGDRQFMNLLIGSGWVNANGGWSALPAGQVDRMGNVTSLQAGQLAARILTPPAAALSGSGVSIRCTWSGTGTVRIAGTRRAGSDVYGDRSLQFFMPAFQSGGWTWLELRATSASDPVRDLDCREADADRQARFSREFLNALKPFGVLRFLDWTGVNDNPVDPQWSERTPENSLRQNPVAWEHMARLAATLDADAWYNVPYDVREDYAVRLGQLIHDLTPAKRKVYVELGNEVWNYGFKAATQAKQEGAAAKLDPADPYRAALLRYAEKTTWLMKLWTPIFADRPGQLVRVAATQNANPSAAEQVLGFRDTAQWVDALATAPYFNVELANNPATVSSLMPLIAAQARGILTDTATRNSQVARRYGKRFIAYEAGQHLVDAANLPRLAEINRSNAMYDIYRSYIANWQARFGDTMMLYASTGPVSQYGAWGLRERAGQPAAETPKYRAAVEFGR